ncbi:MAG: tripartite tricarboxylate transporter TctB family protein [Chloroflexota bacterium]
MKRHNIEQITFLVLMLLLFGWAGFNSLSFPDQAQTYPRTVAFAAVIIVLIELGLYLWGMRSDNEDVPVSETLSGRFRGIWPYLIWLGAFFLVIYLVGIVIASALFVSIFLIREGNVPWYYAVLAGIIVIAFLLVMEDVMSFRWPRSLIDPIEMILG